MPEHRFPTVEAASAFLGPRLDRPVPERREQIAAGVWLHQSAIPLPDGRFTNCTRLSWQAGRAAICLAGERTSTAAAAAAQPDLLAVSTGGFFFLADDCTLRPRCLSLNLALADGRVHSLPVVDQEALIRQDGALRVAVVPARGRLTLAGVPLRWAGARTDHPAEVRVYGNACVIIEHVADPDTGKRRVFRADSRHTPPAPAGQVYLGLHREDDGRFEIAEETAGRMDLFAHDLVLAAPRGVRRGPVAVQTVGELPVAGLSAISVGPALDCPDLAAHPLNREPSLGSTPLLLDRPSSRLIFCETGDGGEHLWLLDGRPGSPVCPGVLMQEAAALVQAALPVRSGCFLDSGQTPRISLRRADGVWEHIGNRHYLRWPTAKDPDFVWTPDAGRPVASLLTVG